MLFMEKSTISTGPWLPVGYVNVHPPGPGAPQEPPGAPRRPRRPRPLTASISPSPDTLETSGLMKSPNMSNQT